MSQSQGLVAQSELTGFVPLIFPVERLDQTLKVKFTQSEVRVMVLHEKVIMCSPIKSTVIQ